MALASFSDWRALLQKALLKNLARVEGSAGIGRIYIVSSADSAVNFALHPMEAPGIHKVAFVSIKQVFGRPMPVIKAKR